MPEVTDLQAVIKQGHAALAAGKADEALRLYAAAVAEDSENFTARTGMGGALMMLERNTDAIEQFRKAVALRPNSAAALTNLARAYKANKEYTVAENLLKQALARDPSYTKAQQLIDELPADRPAPPPPRTIAPPPSQSAISAGREAAALLTAEAHFSRQRANEHRGRRALIIALSLMAAVFATNFIVRAGLSRAMQGRKVAMSRYRSPRGDFEVNVPAGWITESNVGAFAAAMDSVSQTFRPPGWGAPKAIFGVDMMPALPMVTEKDLFDFAGHFDSRGTMTDLASGNMLGPRYPASSKQAVNMGGANGLEVIMTCDDQYEKEQIWIWNRLCLRSGKIYCVHFMAPKSQYDKYIAEVTKCGATFTFTTPTQEERDR